MKISIIIPVLNEENILHKTLSSIDLDNDSELIIVDGGSLDNTIEIARKFTNIVIQSKKGRGTQLSIGAQNATGDILFFLHADCIPPKNFLKIIRETLSTTKNIAGAFMLCIDSNGLIFRIIEWVVLVRTRITKIPYGDQGLFMTKTTYDKIGGFSDLPLMEDIDIAQRLNRHGRIIFLREKMTVSPRRWLKEGIIYTTIRDWRIALMFTIFKVNPERLLGSYKDVR